jgi:beta-glucanase (GH16 family)
MNNAKWLFFTLALTASANCSVKSDGLALSADPSAENDGGPGAGGTTDPGSTTVSTGGLSAGGATRSGGAIGAGGAITLGGATNAGGTTNAGGASGTGGATGPGGALGSGGAAGTGGTTGSGGILNNGGNTGLGGISASGGDTGAGGNSGAGGTPNPDAASDSADVPVTDVAPDASTDVFADVPADERKFDVLQSPADAIEAASPDTRPAMTLRWSDEFDSTTKTGVDPSKWSYVTGPSQVNNEAQAYTNRLENVFRDGAGNLDIRALYTPYPGNAYTSGRIESNGHFSFKFGRVEVRAKLPAGLGSFPGIIAMGTTGTWPLGGELAIMEQYGQDKSSFYASALAGGAIGSGSGDTGHVKYAFPDATTASSGFHVYSMDWYPDHIVFQVDDIEITRTTYATSSPFYTIPEYLILDLALGGDMGKTIDNSAFPMDMLVDYVRVYSF